MSEFKNARENRTSLRWRLLATVSAIALLGPACGAGEARAADDGGDSPLFWIELGGQLSRLDDPQQAFAPPLMAGRPSIFSPSEKFERLPLYSIDESAKISFEPESSDWVLSASVRYGRSNSNKDVRQQTNPPSFIKYPPNYPGEKTTNHAVAAKFADTNVQSSESHAVLDFQVGKDVGLGMFGDGGGSSIVSVGVRFAQFSAKSNFALKSNPDWHRNYKYLNYPSVGYTNFKITAGQPYHANAAGFQALRSFHGIGPAISWNASAPFAGNSKDGEIAFDWGLNAAILFGRQKATVHHQATGQYHGAKSGNGVRVIVYQPTPVNLTRAHTVTVPNVGGFAGLSFRYSNAKLSFGYRADLFFNAMDGGIDTRKSEGRGFYGPFASVSVGIGG
jgi:iron complex outermembrane receptor protein